MGAAMFGNVLGLFIASILVPVLLLIVFRFTPLRRRPALTYGIAGVLAALTPFVTAAENVFPALIASIMAAFFFAFGYLRAAARAR